ncbi:LamG domain-containing protein [Hyphococcus sp.]|uniref:LamG domain-containing protein n=1 Tax=Hyphococcus sp. TaxID=2038636 RepID=UPI003CCBA854
MSNHRRYAYLIGAACLGATALAQSPGGELVYLPMNGSIEDTASGLPPVYAEGFTETEGKIGSALHFAGAGSAELPVDLNPDVMPAQTVSMWIKIDPLPEDVEAIGDISSNGILLSGGGLEISVADARKRRPYIASTQWTSKHLGIRDYWMHVAVTRKIEDRETPDGLAPHTVKTVYLNGVPHEYAHPGKTSGSRSIFIGNLNKNAWSAYHGAIDELRIFPRILTKDEIDQLRTASPDASVQTASVDQSVAFPGDQFEEELTEEQYEEMSQRAAEREAARRAEAAKSASETNENVRKAIAGDVDGGDPIGDSPIARRAREAETQRRIEDAAESVSSKTPGISGVVRREESRGDIDAAVAPPISGVDRAAADIARNDNAVVSSSTPNPNVDPNVRIDEETQKALAFADWRIAGRDRIPDEVRAGMTPGAEMTLNIRIRKNDPENKIPDVRLVFNPRKSGSETIILPLRVMTSKVKPEAARTIPVTFTIPKDFDFDGGSSVLWKPLVRLVPHERGVHHLEDSDPENHRLELSLRILNTATQQNCLENERNPNGSATKKDCLVLLFNRAPEIPSDADTNIESIGNGLVATAITGSRGDNAETVLIDKFNISAFHTRERKDKPCAFDYGAGRVGPCKHNGNKTPKNLFTVSAPTLVEIVEGAVTGLQLCHRRANDRVKGARLFWRGRNPDGSLSVEERMERTFERPNCNEWKRVAACPIDREAVGLRVHWRDGSGLAPMAYLVGAQLVCGPLK